MLRQFSQEQTWFPDPALAGQIFVGCSSAIQHLIAIARKAAAVNSTVIISGETGTGKETFARLIHGLSPRAAHPLIPVDCTALPESLFESELFGHVKGSFTGAQRDSLGHIRSANLGTLFLDEIGELSLGLQAKFLRVLQERRVVPLGASTPRPVDIRVICATNRDLEAMVAAGTFREDLYYRLAVVPLELPPLRARPHDIIPMAMHRLRQLAQTYGTTPKELCAPVAEALMRYSWPGNIRELYNAAEHAYVLSEGPTLELCDLPPRMRIGTGQPREGSHLNLAAVEQRTIIEALQTCNYNRTAACRLLGIELRRLNRRMAALVIDMPVKSTAARSRKHRFAVHPRSLVQPVGPGAWE